MRGRINLIPALLAVLCCLRAVVGINIISRSQWGARKATETSSLPSNLKYAVIHHSGGAYCSTSDTCKAQMRNIQDYHMKVRKYSDIGYNFGIGGDGTIYEGRGFGVVGAHTLFGWNHKSIAIMFMGNYDNNKPTSEQIAKAKDLLAYAVSKGYLSPNYTLYGHRQLDTTECPGDNLFNEIKTWPKWKA